MHALHIQTHTLTSILYTTQAPFLYVLWRFSSVQRFPLAPILCTIKQCLSMHYPFQTLLYYPQNVVRQVTRCFPMLHFASVYPLIVKFSNYSFLIMSPMNTDSRFLILNRYIFRFHFPENLLTYSNVPSMFFSASFCKSTSQCPQVFFFIPQ